MLFVFTALLAPVIWLLRRPIGLQVIGRLAARSNTFWVVLAAGTPIGFLEAAYPFNALDGLGGWGRYSFAIFLLLGYLLPAGRRFNQALFKHRKAALFTGVITFLFFGALFAICATSETTLQTHQLRMLSETYRQHFRWPELAHRDKAFGICVAGCQCRRCRRASSTSLPLMA